MGGGGVLEGNFCRSFRVLRFTSLFFRITSNSYTVSARGEHENTAWKGSHETWSCLSRELIVFSSRHTDRSVDLEFFNFRVRPRF